MIVTKIEAVTKTRFKVYIDGQFAFVLYKGELSRFHIKEEANISQELICEIKNDIILKRAKLRAMHLLESMGRTESQLRDKLIQGYSEDIVEKAIAYVKSFGYVDDLNYAVNYIRWRKDKKSRRELQMQLRGKGVSQDILEQAFEECYEKEDAVEAIKKLLIKRRYDPEAATPQEKQKQMAYLVRKGFAYDDVKSAMQLDILYKTE